MNILDKINMYLRETTPEPAKVTKKRRKGKSQKPKTQKGVYIKKK